MADLREFLTSDDIDDSGDEYDRELAKYADTDPRVPYKLFGDFAPGLSGRERAAAIDSKMRNVDFGDIKSGTDDDINAAIAASLEIIDRAKCLEPEKPLGGIPVRENHSISDYFDDDDEPQPFRMPPPSKDSPLARLDAILATQTRHSSRLMEIRNLVSGMNKNMEDFDGDVFLNMSSTIDSVDSNTMLLMENVANVDTNTQRTLYDLQRRMDVLSGQMEKLTTVIVQIAKSVEMLVDRGTKEMPADRGTGDEQAKKSTSPVLAAYE